MSSIVIQPTSTAQWYQLVSEAQTAAEFQLQEDLESYLVFLLMRFVKNSDIVKNVMALEYLNSLLESGHLRCDKLRDVGDQCLILSGLFPNNAESRRVNISYFIELGRGAYLELSDSLDNSYADIFVQLSQSFISLMDVLQAMRQLGSDKPLLNPLKAIELYLDTGSKQAKKNLEQETTATPFLDTSDQTH